jgi:PAS domain S-box-containing protein
MSPRTEADPGMLARVREFDWAATPLGPIRDWPHNLRAAVDICLNSRFPMVIWWGRDLTLIYNDAWRPIIGTKHPDALGKPGEEVFPEIWHIIGPMHHAVLDTGQATWSDDQLLAMRRNPHLDLEEAYFTWSYSAIPNEDGSIGGVFTAVNETTDQVLSQRRLETLRKLSARAADARTVAEACQGAAHVMEENDGDIAFALLYVVDSGRKAVRLIETVRLERGAKAAPEEIVLEDRDAVWPVHEAMESNAPLAVSDIGAHLPGLPGGRWPASAKEALILPLTLAGQSQPGAVVIIGLSPYLYLDTPYRSFLDLAASHLATGISNATAYENERRRAEALAELDRAKTTFFSNVSHEFRTPLTLMMGPLEDLSRRAPEPWVREQIEIVHRNGLRLLKLVNNLLDFSRIEGGRIQPCYRETDLGAATVELASVFRSAVEKAGLGFTVDCEVPAFAFVDREMWEKIVLNLLSNAFKFTLHGGISVRLRRFDSSIELTVEDTGVGIPGSELQHIFERFHRVTGTRARSHEGTGIGLALVHELAKLHGGSVRVESVEGQGSSFIVSLPTGRAHLPPELVGASTSELPAAIRAEAYLDEAEGWARVTWNSEAADRPAESEAAAGRVLIVDDNADMCDYLRALLSPQYETAVVTNGAEALAAIEKGTLPDLVLTDVMMPVMDGFELLRSVRQNPRTRTLPIIMLSARAGEEARIEGLQAGADDYVVKPFTARELLARVRSQIALARIRRDAEANVRAAEERLRLAVEASHIGTWEMIPETHEIKWDTRHKEIWGFAHDAEITAQAIVERIHPDDRERLKRFAEELNRADAERDYHWEYRIVLPDGAVKMVVVRGRKLLPAPGSDGRVRIVGTMRDVTEEKRAEQSLRETQKLESLGLLAGGIAHDFNNLLTGVIGNASLLEFEFAGGSPQAEIVSALEQSAERMARLTGQMLAYSGRGHFMIEPVDLSRQVVQITNLIQASTPKNVELRLALGNDLPPIEADSSQLQQVIMNLVINAAEAVGDRPGVVEVATGVAPVGEEERRANVTRQDVPPGNYVMLRVSDTGCGMDEATRARIFDPFFTTKFTGRGLGLSSVIGIVRGHKGLMNVDSRPGEGSTFRVFFPPSTAAMIVAQEAPAHLEHGEGTVLVVDDEEIVRQLAKAALGRMGYRVLLAGNGNEALRIFAERADDIDLVLLDMIMPVMGGEETLRRLLALRPDAKVIGMSGYNEREAQERFGVGLAGFVQKPFTAAQLSARLSVARRAAHIQPRA